MIPSKVCVVSLCTLLLSEVCLADVGDVWTLGQDFQNSSNPGNWIDPAPTGGGRARWEYFGGWDLFDNDVVSNPSIECNGELPTSGIGWTYTPASHVSLCKFASANGSKTNYVSGDVGGHSPLGVRWTTDHAGWFHVKYSGYNGRKSSTCGGNECDRETTLILSGPSGVMASRTIAGGVEEGSINAYTDTQAVYLSANESLTVEFTGADWVGLTVQITELEDIIHVGADYAGATYVLAIPYDPKSGYGIVSDSIYNGHGTSGPLVMDSQRIIHMGLTDIAPSANVKALTYNPNVGYDQVDYFRNAPPNAGGRVGAIATDSQGTVYYSMNRGYTVLGTLTLDSTTKTYTNLSEIYVSGGSTCALAVRESALAVHMGVNNSGWNLKAYIYDHANSSFQDGGSVSRSGTLGGMDIDAAGMIHAGYNDSPGNANIVGYTWTPSSYTFAAYKYIGGGPVRDVVVDAAGIVHVANGSSIAAVVRRGSTYNLVGSVNVGEQVSNLMIDQSGDIHAVHGYNISAYSYTLQGGYVLKDTMNFEYVFLKCQETIPGDLDGNCRVDVADFSIFARQWLDCDLSVPAMCFQ